MEEEGRQRPSAGVSGIDRPSTRGREDGEISSGIVQEGQLGGGGGGGGGEESNREKGPPRREGASLALLHDFTLLPLLPTLLTGLGNYDA